MREDILLFDIEICAFFVFVFEERADAVDHGYLFLHQYFQLASEADASGRPNYKLRQGRAVLLFRFASLEPSFATFFYFELHHQTLFL